MGEKIRASVVMITKNEAENIEKSLKAVQGFSEIILVDDESKDATREIAERFNARVFIRRFDDFASQKNFGLDQATQDWIFSLDADEIPDEELLRSICAVVTGVAAANPASGYSLKRRNRHFGRELKWGCEGRDFPIRLFRKGKGRFVNRIHEVVALDGRAARLKGTLLHESNQTASEYLEKLARYTALEARVASEKGEKISFWNMGLKPALRFLYIYFIRLGFLDGFEGFLFHALSSFYLVIKQARLADTHG